MSALVPALTPLVTSKAPAAASAALNREMAVSRICVVVSAGPKVNVPLSLAVLKGTPEQ